MEKNEGNKADKSTVNNGWKLIQEYKVAGAYTWTAPDLFNGKDYNIGVLVIGGGGSGGVASFYNSTGQSNRYGHLFASGGASGYSKYFTMKVAPNSSHNIVVGAKGVSASNNPSDSTEYNRLLAGGKKGGASSFDGIVAEGGNGGSIRATTDTTTPGADGAQPSMPILSSLYNIINKPFYKQIPFGGVIVCNYRYQNSYELCEHYNNPLDCYNPFENKKILGAGGGGGGSYVNDGYRAATPGGKDPITKLGGGDGNRNGNGESATDSGCGGGAAVVYSSSTTSTGVKKAYSGAGADGIVKIYVQGG